MQALVSPLPRSPSPSRRRADVLRGSACACGRMWLGLGSVPGTKRSRAAVPGGAVPPTGFFPHRRASASATGEARRSRRSPGTAVQRRVLVRPAGQRGSGPSLWGSALGHVPSVLLAARALLPGAGRLAAGRGPRRRRLLCALQRPLPARFMDAGATPVKPTGHLLAGPVTFRPGRQFRWHRHDPLSAPCPSPQGCAPRGHPSSGRLCAASCLSTEPGHRPGLGEDRDTVPGHSTPSAQLSRPASAFSGQSLSACRSPCSSSPNRMSHCALEAPPTPNSSVGQSRAGHGALSNDRGVQSRLRQVQSPSWGGGLPSSPPAPPRVPTQQSCENHFHVRMQLFWVAPCPLECF